MDKIVPIQPWWPCSSTAKIGLYYMNHTFLVALLWFAKCPGCNKQYKKKTILQLFHFRLNILFYIETGFILHWNRLVYIYKINTWLYFWDVKCATAIFFLQTSGLFALPHFSWYKIGEKCHSKMYTMYKTDQSKILMVYRKVNP